MSKNLEDRLIILSIIIILCVSIFMGKVNPYHYQQIMSGTVETSIVSEELEDSSMEVEENGEDGGILEDSGSTPIASGVDEKGILDTFINEYNETNITNIVPFFRGLSYFIVNIQKLDTFKMSKDLTKNIIPLIKEKEEEKQRCELQAEQLRNEQTKYAQLNWKHDKITLSSFIIEKLKEHELIYEINYNFTYDKSPEEDNQQNSGENQEVGTVISKTDTFKVTIYKVDQDGNYEKLKKVLNDIYIQEPYEIEGLDLYFDELTESYAFSFVIKV